MVNAVCVAVGIDPGLIEADSPPLIAPGDIRGEIDGSRAVDRRARSPVAISGVIQPAG